MKKITKAMGLAVLLSLSGCKSVLDAPTQAQKPVIHIPHNDQQWQAHLAKLSQIQHYKTDGQFGYNSPANFGLELSSNLSSKSLKLHRNAKGLTVSDSEGNSRSDRDIDALMQEIIGVSFPIDQLAYWLKGQPEKEGQYIVNEKRQLSQFSYRLNNVNWTVNYVEYYEDRVPNLPKLIVLENGTQTLKIRIDNWVF